MLKEFDLEGKTAIVTGASRGIGRAIALALAEAGADIVAAARTQADLEQTVQEVQKRGRKALAIPTDVTHADQVQNMVDKAISQFGKIDILVNDAGTIVRKPVVPTSEAVFPYSQFISDFHTPFTKKDWNRVMDTNVTGVFLCCRAVGPHLIAQKKGKVLNIASISGAKGDPYYTVYCSSKAAVSMFTRCLALEWAKYNINVNAIGPGEFPDTQMGRWIKENEPVREQRLRSIPLRRFGNLRELGLLAIYLASEASDYITGQTIFLDGGYLA